MNKVFLLTIAIFASPMAVAHETMPSNADVTAKIPAIQAEIRETLDRASRERPGIGALTVDLPPALIKPMQGGVSLEDIAARFNPSEAIEAVMKPGGGADLIIFVSFSMPDAMLSEYARQAKEAGGVLALRGVKGSFGDAVKRIAKLNADTGASWIIHPEAFKQFRIDRVPAIVLADTSAASVTEEGCSEPGTYAVTYGDISIEQSLGIMRRKTELPLISVNAKSRLDAIRHR
jgi:conjugal transfer pilus assembly protein TrbC